MLNRCSFLFLVFHHCRRFGNFSFSCRYFRLRLFLSKFLVTGFLYQEDTSTLSPSQTFQLFTLGAPTLMDKLEMVCFFIAENGLLTLFVGTLYTSYYPKQVNLSAIST